MTNAMRTEDSLRALIRKWKDEYLQFHAIPVVYHNWIHYMISRAYAAGYHQAYVERKNGSGQGGPSA